MTTFQSIFKKVLVLGLPVTVAVLLLLTIPLSFPANAKSGAPYAVPNSTTDTRVYSETFTSYTYKDYTDKTVWDLWAHQLRMRRSDAKSAYTLASGCQIDMAGSDSVYVVWVGGKANSPTIYAQRLDSRGNRLWEHDVKVNDAGVYSTCPSVDVDASGNAVIVWDMGTGPMDIYAQKLDANGSQLWSGDVRVSQTAAPNDRRYPAVKVGPGGISWVTWYMQYADNTTDIFAQKLDSAGTRLLVNDVRVNAGQAQTRYGFGPYALGMAVDPAGYVTVAWMDQRNGDLSTWGNNIDIYAQRLAPAGSQQWAADVRVNSDSGTGTQMFPAVASVGVSDSIVVWSGEDSAAQKLDSGGAKLWGSDVSLGSLGSDPPAIAVDSSDQAIITSVWGNKIMAHKIGTDGVLAWGVSGKVVHTESSSMSLTNPVVVMNSQDDATISWMAYSWVGNSNVRMQQIDPNGIVLWQVDAWVNDDKGPASQTKPTLATNSAGISFLAWKDDRRGSDDIYAQTLSVGGARRWNSDIRVNTLASGAIETPPSVSLINDQSAMLVWVQGGTVYAQRLDTNGNKLWAVEVQVNTLGYADQVDSAVLDPAGNILVVWRENSTVWAQKLDPQGQKLWSADVQVAINAERPIVASNGAGSAVVAWIEQNAGQYQLYAQKLDTSGVLGWATKKQVNTTAMDFSSLCGIALDSTGNSFFDWTRDYEMGGIYAQKLNASGVKLWNSGADVPLTASSPTFADDGRDVAIDPSGNSYMAYVGYCGVNYSTCTKVQKLDASGNKGWLASTALSSDERYQQRGTAIAYDSTTGIFLAWQDEHNANWDIYANRLYTDSTSAWVTYTQVIAPDSFYLLAGTVQSRQVNTGTETVRSALLTADYELNSGSVQFSLSNNGGVTWYPVLPGVTQVFTTTGSDLRWRADLTADPLWPRAPVINSLSIEYSVLPPGADDYEPDDTCGLAKPIDILGAAQTHNFHQNADADWIWFDVVSDTTYIIQTANPMTNADTILNLYSGCPIGGLTPLASDSNPYGREARITWKASLTGTVFASVTNATATVAGADTGYNLSVRTSEQLPVAIIVVSDVSSATLQAHLDTVGDTAYRTFLATRMLKDNIRYFGPDPSRDVDDNGLGDDIIGPPDPLAVRDAIQDWARTRGVGLGVPFYLVLVGDGSTDEFLAEGASSTITAENLNLWLSNLEATSGADNINVIIEASKSGSFIDVTTAGPATISGHNRVIVTSTSSDLDAYLSMDGAYFSDAFFTALGENKDVKTAFDQARQAVEATGLDQQPWLDDNGDALPEVGSSTSVMSLLGGSLAQVQPGTFASNRGLGIASPTGAPVIDWLHVGAVTHGQATVEAQVRDDAGVQEVHIVIYPPDFVAPPPAGGGIPVVTVPIATLTLSGTDRYAAVYPSFTLSGQYRVVVYAQDTDGNQAIPVVVFVNIPYQVYIPVLSRH